MTFEQLWSESSFMTTKDVMRIFKCKNTKASAIIRTIKSVKDTWGCSGKVCKEDYDAYVQKYGSGKMMSMAAKNDA